MNGFTNLESFLKSYTIKSDEDKPITHTEFGKFAKRKFSIEDDVYEQFIKLYYDHIIKLNKNHNLIERQLCYKNENTGPLLLDVDLQFSIEHSSRQYNQEHYETVIDIVLNLFYEMFEMDDDNTFLVAVQEKPAPRSIQKPNNTNIVKDGFHIMFCIRMKSAHHKYIRTKLIEVLSHSESWSSLPLINSLEDVFDPAISNGTNGWLAPLSQKADDKNCYDVSQAYNINYNTTAGKWNKISTLDNNNKSAFYAQNYKKLFIRNKSLPEFELETELFSQEINKIIYRSPKEKQITVRNFAPGGDEYYQISINVIREIRSKEDMDNVKNMFIDNLPEKHYVLKEAFDYCMTLPESYYGTGSYNKWIKVGFALRNTSYYLLIAWIVFSSQSSSFDFAIDISNICELWQKFSTNPESGVTKLSLMYWSKTESPDAFNKIHQNSVDFYIEESISHISLNHLNAKNKVKTAPCDYDIAKVVYQLKKGHYVSCGIKSNSWYIFNGSCWSKNDSGTTLRNTLSTEVRMLYANKSKKLLEKALQIKTPEGDTDTENEEYLILKGKADILFNIATRLGQTQDKDKIMRECRELFYDSEFERKLDQNRYLLCFKNGVIDFKEKRFRRGYPEDYLSKCTRTDYIKLDRNKNSEIIKEIEDYFIKNFPIPELCEYMWNHLASILIGDTAKTQCLHYYTGIGQNGKSMLVKFFQMILGDYATELDVSFFVNERPSRGKATPELLSLVGARFAITAEPSQGEKLNEGPMKQLTSGTDKITYRGLFQDQESFIPQVHSVIMANEYLPVKSRDHGTWRRIRVVKFLSLFVDHPKTDDPDKPYQFKREENFDEKFKLWAPVFMALLIEIAYKNQGSLPICPIVEEYSNEYRRGQDFIASFIDQKIVPGDPTDKLRKTHISREFAEWYEDTYGSVIKGKNQELFASIEKKYGKPKSNGWAGLKLIRETQEINETQSFSTVITDSESESILSR